jgi:two-component system, cell cycle response regulator
MEQSSNSVLIIEDKQESALFLEEVISAAGYKVWLVPNGKEGIKLINSTSFVAVLTELHMPGMSGLEITRKALGIVPFLSIVVITAYSFVSSAVEAMEAGAYGYVTKPFNPAEIRIVLERAVERSRLMSVGREREYYANLSIVDGLTGVYNHRFFEIFMEDKLTLMKHKPGGFSLLMIDVDDFKNYNDTNGHQAGDELLSNFSKCFSEALKAGDLVFRYGGEEFAVFLDNANKKTGADVAERIRTLAKLYLPRTVSIGVSSYPEDGTEFKELVSCSDSALYRAKKEGKNRVCFS